MSKMDDHIRERLDGFYENNYTTVTDVFILQFGPYMSMTHGYETEVDAISKKNPLMKFFQHAAYIIRGFNARMALHIPDKELREFLKTVLLEVDNEFPKSTDGEPNERTALIRLIEDSNSKILKRTTESVMTNVAPIVPYSQQIERKDLGFGDLVVEESSGDEMEIPDNSASIKHTIYKLLFENDNLEHIMMAYDLTQYSSAGVDGIHDIMNRCNAGPVRDYYVLALINYIAPTDNSLIKLVSLHTYMESLIEEESYEAFESTINACSKKLEGIMEDSWEDFNVEENDETVVNTLVSNIRAPHKPSEDSSFDIDGIYNFIALNQYMQFDEWSRRLYLDNFKDKDDQVYIVNINKLGKDIIAYEINTDLLVIPFTDLRDYKVRYLYLRRDEKVPFIDERFITS